jgi:translation initiation factor IF-1
LDEPITDQENAIAREEKLEFEGEVLEALGGGMFRVELEKATR